MKKLLCVFAISLGIVGLGAMFMMQQPAYADDLKANILTGCAQQANDPNGGGIWCIINIVLTVLTFGVVTLATLGLIISGAQYITSADNPERMAKAKNRIINVVIGLVAYAVMWAALNWLLPGGIFH